jgi:hypothetical protein
VSTHVSEPADLHPVDQLAPMIEGELDLAELRTVVRHVRRCPACQAELVEVAAALGALRGVARDGLDDIAEPPPLAVHPIEAVPSPADRSGTARAERGPRSRPTMLAAAAAVVVVVLLGAGLLVRTQLGEDPATPPVATVQLLPEGSIPDASGVVTMTDGDEQTMTVSTTQLPPAPAGTFYEVWLLQPDTGQMLAVGVLPDSGETSFDLPAELVANYQAVDVSLQPDDGGILHSGDSVLRATYA